MNATQYLINSIPEVLSIIDMALDKLCHENEDYSRHNIMELMLDGGCYIEPFMNATCVDVCFEFLRANDALMAERLSFPTTFIIVVGHDGTIELKHEPNDKMSSLQAERDEKLSILQDVLMQRYAWYVEKYRNMFLYSTERVINNLINTPITLGLKNAFDWAKETASVRTPDIETALSNVRARRDNGILSERQSMSNGVSLDQEYRESIYRRFLDRSDKIKKGLVETDEV